MITQFSHLQLLKTKDETLQAYQTFESWCDTQLGVKIKKVHSDCGGEYLRKDFELHLKKQGTKQELTMHNTSQHNGVAEH
jgi:hypothetical protein